MDRYVHMERKWKKREREKGTRQQEGTITHTSF
jgi:hypothetical protein